jgi:hypothetical protein
MVTYLQIEHLAFVIQVIRVRHSVIKLAKKQPAAAGCFFNL